MTQQEYLNTLHSTLLEILDTVVNICERHQLTYFLAYGSCLGAVRHQGFIPWDDDIDIGMPRQDYDRFVEICKTELPTGYYYQGLENEEHYWLSYSKVRKAGTLFVEKYTENAVPLDKQGIFIDVFPFEGVHSLSKKVLNTHTVIRKLKVALYLKLASNETSDCGLGKRMIASIIPWKIANMWMRRLMNSMNDDDPKLFLSSAQMNPLTVGFLLADDKGRIPVVRVPFEDRIYCIPSEYDAYLTNLYKNYMQLPPEAKRRTHMPVKVDFGDGEITLEAD